jgi:ketosteroid isomerase-like protein
MKLIAITLLSIASVIPSANAADASSQASDEAAIKAQVESYRKAFEARNVDGIMAAYATGQQLFVFDAVPPREYPSWEAYKKDWESLFAIFPGPVKDAISELKITVVGPVAYGHRIEDTHFTKKDGSDQELIVRVTDVYRKIGGKWLVVQEHVSFPADPTTGKADLLSKP